MKGSPSTVGKAGDMSWTLWPTGHVLSVVSCSCAQAHQTEIQYILLSSLKLGHKANK